ncbi:MAG: putative bifunctional diguanylate cyclase/phosphodiesterase [Thioalkalivibrionaceae bacterium]
MKAITPFNDPTEARILAVDDNPMNVELLIGLLEAAGFTNVEGETDPEAAIERWRREDFDLLLLDIRMPKIDGHAVMSTLQRDLDSGDWLPVIVLTAQTDTETRDRALAAGARDFITKPFDTEEVVQRIRNLLEVRATHNAARVELQELHHSLLDRDLELASREADLEHLAHHDPVNGLPNRVRALQILGARLESVQVGQSQQLILMTIDIQGEAETAEGVFAADTALREAAERLLSELPDQLDKETRVAYWGNDTYLLILPTGVLHTAEQIEHFVERLENARISIGRGTLRPRVAASSVIAPQDGTSSDLLLRRLMLTLARVRRNNQRHAGYAEIVEQEAGRLQRLEHDLDLALERGELRLVYQPKVDIGTGRITGVEALMRWQHSDLGPVSPGEFIPIAETNGRIIELTDFAIQEGIRALARIQAQTGTRLSMAINVSARMFELASRRRIERSDPSKTPPDQPNRDPRHPLVLRVERILHETGIDAAQIELEVTETAVIANLAETLDVLEQLRALGVRIALDDFGTGYSSLAYLSSLPVDTLKIDRSLVDGIATDAKLAGLFRAIVGIAQSLNLDTVAEGIEREEDRGCIALAGCNTAQGFFFHKPMSLDALCEVLPKGRPDDNTQDIT